MDWQEQLISLYLTVCKEYQQELSAYIVRLSNYIPMDFTDEEVITLYLFGVINGYRQIKKIHNYVQRHLRDWFPHLPKYEGFNYRLNQISHLFEPLVSRIMAQMPLNLCDNVPLLIDSMPIILAKQGRRFTACVAQEIATNNGYCATKKLHYYGVKLHVMGQQNKGALPIPVQLGITNAGTGDIKVLDDLSETLPYGTDVFADKAYQRGNMPIEQRHSIKLHTPVKKEKGQERLDAADKALSSAISSVRQPIESFFNWIEEKTNIQIACKVRSYEGLMVHVFGKIAAALFLLKDRFCP
jgi:hypothetical protein